MTIFKSAWTDGFDFVTLHEILLEEPFKFARFVRWNGIAALDPDGRLLD